MRTTDQRIRHSSRLKGYDYSRTNVYYITICTFGRDCLFGEVKDAEMILNAFGSIVEEEYLQSAEIRQEIELDTHIVMPNHVHGIVRIRQAAGAHGGRLGQASWKRKPRSLGSFVAGFKSAVTKRVNQLRDSPGQPVWQRNYHDHIIRSDEAHQRIRQYILDNPKRWAEDPENPAATSTSV